MASLSVAAGSGAPLQARGAGGGGSYGGSYGSVEGKGLLLTTTTTTAEEEEGATDMALAQGQQQQHRPRAVRVRHLDYTVVPAWSFDYVTLREHGLRRPPARRVLHNVSFDLPPGCLMAILGSSGSGKTTLLDLMACREDGGTRTGEVLIDGEPSTPALIKRIGGYVVQEDRLLPLLTVRETLLFVARIKMPPALPEAVKIARVDAVMSELGLRHVRNTCIGGNRQRGISGGERRRVSIAAQLLLDPGAGIRGGLGRAGEGERETRAEKRAQKRAEKRPKKRAEKRPEKRAENRAGLWARHGQ